MTATLLLPEQLVDLVVDHVDLVTDLVDGLDDLVVPLDVDEEGQDLEKVPKVVRHEGAPVEPVVPGSIAGHERAVLMLQRLDAR